MAQAILNERKWCKYSPKMDKTLRVKWTKVSLARWLWIFFSKISSNFIYQAKEVWFVGLYQKMIDIYQENKS